MNMNDKIEEAKGFVLSHWHTFGGGIVIGALAAWALVKLHIL